MSTLGDLLAEHTVLPGNAVDHLHAVVGEWQLLADLSFADYLMWVRRDDGVLVCVAQCRPNTAPTVLLSDAVGTTAGADEMPLVTAAFQSGAIGQESVGGQQDSQEDGGLNVEAVPVRYDNQVVAVLTHQTALAARRKASPLEARLPGLCGRPAAHAVRGDVPQCGRPGDVAVQPPRRRRFHPARRGRRRRLRQPQRAVGLSPDGSGRRIGGTQPGHHYPAADLRPVRGAGTGRAHPRLAGRRVEHADGGRRRRRGRSAAHPAAGRARKGGRCRGADSRRHRGQAPRPRAAVQGRDHPRNPSPGEEQPADRGGAASPAGPAHQQRRGPRSVDRIGAAGVVHRVGARCACRCRWTRRSTSTRWWTGSCRS